MKSHTKRLIVINLLLLFAMTALHSQVVYFIGKDVRDNLMYNLDSVKIINNTLQRDTTITGNSIDLSVLTAVDDKDNFNNSDFTVEYISELGSNAISFRVKANKGINLSINIYNIVGRTILSLRQNLPEGNHNVKINEYLLPGFYFATFSDGGTSQTIKILKTNELFSNYSFAYSNPQEKKIVLNSDSYTFIGYLKGYRGDTINTIPEDGKMYMFQLVKIQMIFFTGKNKATNEPIKLDSIRIINNKLQHDTTITGNSYDLSLLTIAEGQEKKQILFTDSYTFIGYAMGFRRDTIETIPEEEKTYEFEFVKLGNFEFNDWKIYLSSMNLLSNVKEHWNTGWPPNEGEDSNVYKEDYETKVIDYSNSEFNSDNCDNEDTIGSKYKYDYCCRIGPYKSKEFYYTLINLKFYFNLDTINNRIDEIKIIYEFYGENSIMNDFYDELYDNYFFILRNIPYNYLNDGSVIAEINSSDYKSVLKNNSNYYYYLKIEGFSASHRFSKHIEWYRLNKINNDIFFRLVLSK